MLTPDCPGQPMRHVAVIEDGVLTAVRPMTVAAFDAACDQYAFTVSATATLAEAQAHAARFGLLLELAPRPRPVVRRLTRKAAAELLAGQGVAL